MQKWALKAKFQLGSAWIDTFQMHNKPTFHYGSSICISTCIACNANFSTSQDFEHFDFGQELCLRGKKSTTAPVIEDIISSNLSEVIILSTWEKF